MSVSTSGVRLRTRGVSAVQTSRSRATTGGGRAMSLAAGDAGVEATAESTLGSSAVLRDVEASEVVERVTGTGALTTVSTTTAFVSCRTGVVATEVRGDAACVGL